MDREIRQERDKMMTDDREMDRQMIDETRKDDSEVRFHHFV
jgi:hypothetical protein